jgi:putative flippase GtrA
MSVSDNATAAAAAAPAPRPPLAALLGAVSGEFWRYLAASVASLGLDFGLLWLLTERAGLHYLTSAALSYSAGCALHYAISVTLVFRARRVADRRMEFAGFFAIGLLGLAANQLVLKAAVELAGVGYLLGKVAATGVSFVLTFVTRRAVLFTATRMRA